MNLTVKDALSEGIENAGALATYADLNGNLELSMQLREMKNVAEGCLEMLSDLVTAHESLQEGGYSQEWFDLCNQGGNFLTILNMEMPKFFGGDQAKYDACNEALMDTIKIWAEKFWNVLKNIVKFILDMISKLARYWSKNRLDSTTRFQTRVKLAKAWLDKMEEGRAKQDAEILAQIEAEAVHFTSVDIDVLNRYFSRLHVLEQVFAQLKVDDICGDPENKSGNLQLEVMSQVHNLCLKAGIQPDFKYNGFDVTGTSINFCTPSAIPKREYSIIDRNTFDTIVSVANDIGVKSKLNHDGLENTRYVVAEFYKACADQVNWLKQQKANTQFSVLQLKRAGVLLGVIKATIEYHTRLSMEWERFGLTWEGVINEITAKHPTW